MDELQGALERLRDILVQAEDRLATVCMCPAALPMYDYEWHGEVRQKRVESVGRRVKTPVAYVRFDGESLTLERFFYPREILGKKGKASRWQYWNPQDPRTDDVLSLGTEDCFWVCGVTRLLPEMYARLVADSQVDPEEIQAAVEKCQEFLATLRVSVAE